MKKLTMLFGLAASFAAAQTVTYNLPTGLVCNGQIEHPPNPAMVYGCTFHNLQPEQPTDGGTLPYWALPFAWFTGGGYYPQIDFQQYMGQNAAYSAVYWENLYGYPPAGVWSTTQLDSGETLLAFDGQRSNASTSNLGGLFLSVHTEIQAHSFKVGPYPCSGGKGSRGTCYRYDWAIDSGFVNLTPVQ